MIKTKKDLADSLEECRKAYGKGRSRGLMSYVKRILFPDSNYEFMRNLCYLEYYTNCGSGGAVCFLLKLYHTWRKRRLYAITGIELGVNCAGYGLHVAHGRIVVNGSSKIGDHCKILSEVTIGGQGRYDVEGAPHIGDRVYVGSGAKLIGNIKIADGVVIGANSVVTSDILEPNTTWAGIPARKISDNCSNMYLRECFRV